ncbi:MAG TPA: glycosyltransferase [Candidatus Sulfotelmatobacter sp.]|nr:glycosyltransferase [Candidatus Sulfotelmatobacter sp.]
MCAEPAGSHEAGSCSLHVIVLPSSYPTFHSPVDGIFVQAQAAALKNAALRVGVVYPDMRSLRTLPTGRLLRSRFQMGVQREQEVETIRIHAWNIPFRTVAPRLWQSLALRGFAAYVKRFGHPDLIHAHNSLWAGAAAREIKNRFGVQYVLTEHSSAYARQLVSKDDEELTRRVFAEASAVMAVSRWLSAGLQPCGEREIRVIPNIVDTDFFTLPPTPRRAKPLRFLTVGLLTPVKGIDLLLRAFSEAFSDSADVELEVAGDGPERPRLQELARSLKISDRVIFSGLRTREQVRESMWRSNAFVTASHVETFGIVLAEALATGLPLISTKCGGPEEIVTGDVGVLVEPGSVNALAGALKEILLKAASYDPLLQRGSAVQRYAGPAVVSRLQDVYQGVLCG